jgi:acyl carrier protein
MDKKEILRSLQVIFRDQLENEAIELTEETTVNDIDGWDSLMHLQLIVVIENHFKIKFTSKEIFFWKNVGEMVASIMKRLENA